jgi:hypothetical protein
MTPVPMSHSAAYPISANVTVGVIEKLRTYFLRYPDSGPRFACRALHLDPKRYGATARVVKSRVRKTWGGANIQGDTLEALTSIHRQLWYLEGGVPGGSVLSALIDLAGRGRNQDDTWYFSNNQNRQLNYRSQYLAIRVLPTTRRLEVLCRMPKMNGIDVRQKFEGILYSTLKGHLPLDHDASHIARDLSSRLVPVERHRRFEFPPGPHYKIRYYEDTLGLVIQHEASETMNEQEAIEKIPPWIPDLIHVTARLAEYQKETRRELQQLKELVMRQQHEPNANANVKTVVTNGTSTGLNQASATTEAKIVLGESRR